MMLRLISTADHSAASVSSQKTSSDSASYVMPADIILAEEKHTLQPSFGISLYQCCRHSGVCTYTHPNRKRAVMLSFSSSGRWSLRICPGRRFLSVLSSLAAGKRGPLACRQDH